MSNCFLFLIFFILAIKGGPVNDEYRFLQFHMHWGDTIERGSEHLIDDKPFAAEVLLNSIK